ncbi:hypothetical protein tb265_46820 [Gemmatimonadetes bacterium T265]|nr:hypothetical protein tb265_46820 [Gemmatimonadetes bacterium T265]
MLSDAPPVEPSTPNATAAGGAGPLAAVADALYLPPAVAERLAATAARVAGARAPNTLRALRADLARWTRWCRAARRLPLPARADDVTAFVDAHATTRAPATLRRYVASVAALHRAAGVPDPTKAEDVRLALTAASRAWADARAAAGQGTRQRQAAGLTERAVAHILASYDADGPARLIDLRDVALLLVARDLLARRSELVAVRVEDVVAADDGGATVHVRRSKTDQFGAGATAYVGPEAYAALRAWLDAAGLAAGPAFRAVSAHGRVGPTALHAQKVPAVLKKLAARAAPQLRRLGLDPAQVSGHSGRVGMAQDLVGAGLELPAVMQAGRWTTPAMVARYAERLLAERGAVAQYHARKRRDRHA